MRINTKRAVLALVLLGLVAAGHVYAAGTRTTGENDMGRIQAMDKNRQKWLGNGTPALADTDPDLAAMRDRLIYGEIMNQGSLDDRQRALVTMAALTASQAFGAISSQTAAALKVGVSPVEIKEAIYQCAAYVGFPRVEAALELVNNLFREKGMKPLLESQATVTENSRFKDGLAVQKKIFGAANIENMQAKAPEGQRDIVTNYLSAFCFGDLYTRKALDLKMRELVTFSAIVALGGCDPQARAHAAANISVGNSRQNLVDALAVMLPHIGFPRTLNGLACVNAAAPEKENPAASFAYDIHQDNALPIPPAEKGLLTAQAEAVFTASPERHTLEGAIFDSAGNLLFCDTTAGRVYRLSPQNEATMVVETPDFAPSGLALHKDGRLFMTALNLQKGLGKILALSPDGKKLDTILPVEAGYLPNDLVFDRNGGFYFTDFRGSATKPEGGVYYVAPDNGAITPVIPNMAQANGVALSPDGKTLWATEYAANRLHRVNLAGSAKVTPTGSKVPYNFIGPAPDSMRVDSDGNVYVAMVGQGRVMIFNPNGMPIGQVLLPGREKGRNLRSTSLAIHPQKKEMRVVSGNTAEADKMEAMIFAAPAFATGLPAPK